MDEIKIEQGSIWEFNTNPETRKIAYSPAEVVIVGATSKWVFLIITSGANKGTASSPAIRKWPKDQFYTDFVPVRPYRWACQNRNAR